MTACSSARRARSRSDCSICGICVVLDVDVEGDDLDAGVDGALGGFLHRFRQAVLDDDALHAERDGLVDHVGLKRCVLPAVEHAQVDAERLGLCLDAGQIGLEEVAGRQIAHQRDLDVARLVERRRHVGAIAGVPHQAGCADKTERCSFPRVLLVKFIVFSSTWLSIVASVCWRPSSRPGAKGRR